MKVVFHQHTRFSKDSYLCLWALRLKCKLKKVDCICVTDHNEIAGALEFKNKYENSKFQVIIGEEIFTDSGEIIGLFLREKILSGLTPEETVKEIEKQGGIVIIPHPYEVERGRTALKEEFFDKIHIDAMENYNGRNFKEKYSIIQNQICEKFSFPKIVGSDAHTFFEVANNYIICDYCTLDANNFIDVVCNGKFHMKHASRIFHFHTKIVKLLKRIFK